MIGFHIIIADSKQEMLGFKRGPSRLAQPLQLISANSHINTKENELDVCRVNGLPFKSNTIYYYFEAN